MPAEDEPRKNLSLIGNGYPRAKARSALLPELLRHALDTPGRIGERFLRGTSSAGRRPGLNQHGFMGLNYLIVIRANTLEEVTEEALHFAYLFLGRSLQRRRQDGDEEYEEFALSVLALLRQYRHLYTTPPKPPNPE